MLLFLLISVKMSTNVGILIFTNKKNFIFSRGQHENFSYNLGAREQLDLESVGNRWEQKNSVQGNEINNSFLWAFCGASLKIWKLQGKSMKCLYRFFNSAADSRALLVGSLATDQKGYKVPHYIIFRIVLCIWNVCPLNMKTLTVAVFECEHYPTLGYFGYFPLSFF